MTTKSITSDQPKQFKRFVDDASDRALKEVNLDKDALQRLFSRGGEFQAYLVAGIRRFSAKTPDYDMARTILGKDFVSPEEIAKSRKGIAYTDDDLERFGSTLPSQEVLEWCRDNGYMVIAGPPRAMSLLEIRELRSDYFYSKKDGWYADQAFARNDKVTANWVMLRKEPTAGSTSKNWNEQQETLNAELEIVPNAAEVAWCVTTHKAVRGVYLLPSVYVHTSSLGSDGNRVDLGYFGAGGLDVGHYWDGGRDDYLGLASARKQ